MVRHLIGPPRHARGVNAIDDSGPQGDVPKQGHQNQRRFDPEPISLPVQPA